MIGKKFRDVSNDKIVKVVDAFENIVMLEGNYKINKDKLLNESYFIEHIDPEDFLKSSSLHQNEAVQNFIDKIRNTPTESFNDNKNAPIDLNNIKGTGELRPMFDEPAILPSDPELEKQEILRKYGVTQNQQINQNKAQNQYELFKNLLEEPDSNVQKIEVSRDEVELFPQENLNSGNLQNNLPKNSPIEEDPIIKMFRNVKRSKEFKINLEIENKIPRPDFIEMMEDSYSISIIDFLCNEFCNELLKDPNIIKNKIEKEIRRIVYGDDKVEKNPVLDDISTDIKPKRVRKSIKKES